MGKFAIRDLLLAPELDAQEVAALLRPFGFQDIKKADVNIQHIAEDAEIRVLFAEILEECLRCFSETPSPDLALNHFERFSRAVFGKAAFISYLVESPQTLWRLSQVFGNIPFFSEILIRNPEYLYWVFSPEVLERPKKRGELSGELSSALRLLKSKETQLDFLRIFKRKEILRIGVRDLLGKTAVEETLADLSDLADVLIQKAYWICDKEMRRKYGIAMGEGDSGKNRRIGFTVLAMGKLGGRELNFSSDVDLMYLYEQRSGQSSGGRGKDRIPNAVYFEKLSKEVTASLNATTEQGYVYRVDLRLRPEGQGGMIATPFEGYRRYYDTRGETWERLSLVKVRAVAGDLRLGRRFLEMAEPFIYDKSFGKSGFIEVREIKERIEQECSEKKQTQRDVKRGRGGIREIEFIVQSLQVAFGGKDRKIRVRGSMDVLKKLSRGPYLSAEEFQLLSASYLFFRDLENKLQMVRDQQTHLIPTDPDELRATALRMDYTDFTRGSASVQLMKDYRGHADRVHAIFQRVFYEKPFLPQDDV
ncbi:MAG: hypothetical protein ACE5FZ_05915 [Nitrospiria bacterium]